MTDPGPGSADATSGSPSGASRQGTVVLLTGAPGAGKTSTCRTVVEAARQRGLRVAGLLSESRQLTSGRMVQTVVNLRTGDRRRLADLVGTAEGDPIGGGAAGRFSWQFVGEALRWGRHELRRCATADVDLLVIDQLGPLELVAGSGWSNAVETLLSARFDLALVVVNPLVLDELRRRLGGHAAVVVTVDENVRELLPEYLAVRTGWSTVPSPRLLSLDGPDCLATDLDGTLLASTGDPPAPRIEAALRDIVAAGATVCVCTGRPTDFALAAARSLGAGRGYAIAYGGAETSLIAEGEVIERVALPAVLVEATLGVARTLGLDVDRHDSPEGALRLVLAGSDREIQEATLALAEAVGERAQLLRPSAGVLAVQDAGATKERALAGLAKRLRIAPGAIAYFGDAADDAPALAWAGLGIAVGDGSGAAAAAADMVVPRPMIAETLERLALARRLRGAR